ncbi:uncharacterized protein LOC111052954 [Nilaparvata lugens]|uniref:uncharacterized protein LOC111052954 n=1 Tax=Nilaparvata lugens TaxID=108931 RepID=UPI00193DA348|nr:uncharacterized protein LOC111052954 [Nilaparvata lugens]
MNFISFVGLLLFAAILNEVKSAPSSPGSASSSTETSPDPGKALPPIEVDLFDVMDLDRDGVATEADYERCEEGTVLNGYTDEQKRGIKNAIEKGGRRENFDKLNLKKIDVRGFNRSQYSLSVADIINNLNVGPMQASRILGNQSHNTHEAVADILRDSNVVIIRK